MAIRIKDIYDLGNLDAAVAAADEGGLTPAQANLLADMTGGFSFSRYGWQDPHSDDSVIARYKPLDEVEVVGRWKPKSFDSLNLYNTNDATRTDRVIPVTEYRIAPEILARENLQKHEEQMRKYNTDTPGEYAPNGYTMGRLGFDYANDAHTKYKYMENGKRNYQCAYVANRLSSRFRRPTAGNAWTTQGIYGDSTLVDGYNQGLNIRPPFYLQPLVDAYNRRAADYVKEHIGEHTLHNGDIVGMYTAFSPSQKRAYREGLKTRTNTHTGRIVTGLNGAPFVVHNMHGEVRVDPLSELLGGLGGVGVTYISRPNPTPQYQEELERNTLLR